MTAVVALDTSALTLPVELDIRLFDELERLLGSIDPIAPRAVELELRRLGEGSGVPARAAGVGLDLLDEHGRVVGTSTPVADDAVLELALDGPAAYVVTADRDLARRALSAGIAVVSPRGGQHLVVERP